MKKLTKLILVMCMIFSQVASPIKVIAEEITPNYDLDVDVIENTIDNSLIDVTLTDASTGSALDTTAGYQYIVSTDLTFNYVNEDVESIEKIELIDGTDLLTSYTYNMEKITSYYNGSYDINVKLYDIGTELVNDITEDGLRTYVSEMEPKIDKTEENVLENKDIPHGLFVNGPELVCVEDEETHECIDGEFSMPVDATDKEVQFILGLGDLSEEALNGAYMKFEINDKLVIDSYNMQQIQDFSKLLYGDYKYELTIYNSEDEVIFTDSVVITYGDVLDNEELLETYFVIDEEGTEEEIYESIYNILVSSTVLSDSDLADVELDLELLEAIMQKAPIDTLLSDILSTTFNTEIVVNSFSDILEEELTEIIIGDNFIGVFDSDEPSVTVGDIINPINEIDGFVATITDAEGNEVSEEESIGTNMKLNVTIEGITLSYEFAVYGDADDGYVTDEEIRLAFNHANELELLEDLRKVALDVNSDDVIDLLDVTYIAGSVDTGEWLDASEIDVSINSSLKQAITNEEVIRVGDTFKVDYVISGLEENELYINGLEGIIEYDKDSLELVGISAITPMDEFLNFNTETNKFMGATKAMHETDGTLVTITFKAIAQGETTVSVVSDKAASDGVWVTVENEATLDLNIERALSTNNNITELKPSTGTFNQTFKKDVLEYTLYVDYWVNEISLEGILGDEYAKTLGFKEYTLNGDKTVIKLDVVAENGDIKSYTINVVKVYPKSSNNYLESLEIEGYKIEFNKDTLEYEITVKSDVTELDITAIAEDNTARVNIYGNGEFKEGENTVTVVVTAEDGSEKEYTITVNKKAKEVVMEDDEDEEDEEEANNSQMEKTIIIILIILVIIGLLYLIFKKDEDEE